MHSVLVVDDNWDIRMLLRQALEFEGYRVFQAENGAIARQRLTEEGLRPCVLLLDLMMPVMDGREFLEWKNRTPLFSEIPVLIISAGAVAEPLAGTKAFLRKPVDLGEVIDLAQRCCG